MSNHAVRQQIPHESRSEVLQRYLWKGTRCHDRSAVSGDNIDEIDPAIVATVNVKLMLAEAPSFARQALKLVQEKEVEGDDDYNLQPRTLQETADIVARKKSPVDVKPEVARALEKLRKNSHLYEVWQAEKVRDMLKSDPAGCTAGAFFVEKSNGKLRVITDARPANARFYNRCDMEMFTLEALIETVSQLSADGATWRALSLDLRHWFHQIPLPERHRKYFMIQDGRKNVHFVPVATPMGLHSAPAIGEAASWTIVLGNVVGVSRRNLRKQLDLDEPGERYPKWVPLRGGGGIFVLIDNILVVTPSQKVIDQWWRRLTMQARLYSATFKEPKPPIEMMKDGDASFEFCGIEFQHNKRRPTGTPTEISNELWDKPGGWRGTFRDLASVIGECMWSLRVSGHRMLDLSDFLQLYQAAYPPLGESWEAWTALTCEQTKVLRKYYDGAFTRSFTVATQLAPMQRPGFLVTDASLDERRKGAAWIESCDDPEQPMVTNHKHHEETICLGELYAIVKGVESLLRDHTEIDLVMVATDSATAMGMIGRGYSRVPRACELLRRLFGVLGGRRIYAVHVRSEYNAADAPSRDLKADEWTIDNWNLWRDCVKMLTTALKEARGALVGSGKQSSRRIIAPVTTETASGVRREREPEIIQEKADKKAAEDAAEAKDAGLTAAEKARLMVNEKYLEKIYHQEYAAASKRHETGEYVQPGKLEIVAERKDFAVGVADVVGVPVAPGHRLNRKAAGVGFITSRAPMEDQPAYLIGPDSPFVKFRKYKNSTNQLERNGYELIMQDKDITEAERTAMGWWLTPVFYDIAAMVLASNACTWLISVGRATPDSATFQKLYESLRPRVDVVFLSSSERAVLKSLSPITDANLFPKSAKPADSRDDKSKAKSGKGDHHANAGHATKKGGGQHNNNKSGKSESKPAREAMACYRCGGDHPVKTCTTPKEKWLPTWHKND
jgi:hypothetical protein